MPFHPRVARPFILAGLCWACSATAHDTWLQVPAQQPGSGLLALQLGTGGRYPKSEAAIPGSRVSDSGCVDETGARHGLAPRSELPLALELRSRTGAARAVGCWLELLPVDLTLPPDLLETYFHDVRAPQAVRDGWARQQKAGGKWNEVYRKYVRIEAVLPGSSAPQDLSRIRVPRGDALELLPMGADAVRNGTAARFQALANGKPVPGLAVEFVHTGSQGIWKETDAQGRMEVVLPVSGEWLLRATSFDLPAADGIWRTRFATLTVQAQ